MDPGIGGNRGAITLKEVIWEIQVAPDRIWKLEIEMVIDKRDCVIMALV